MNASQWALTAINNLKGAIIDNWSACCRIFVDERTALGNVQTSLHCSRLHFHCRWKDGTPLHPFTKWNREANTI